MGSKGGVVCGKSKRIAAEKRLMLKDMWDTKK